MYIDGGKVLECNGGVESVAGLGQDTGTEALWNRSKESSRTNAYNGKMKILSTK